MKAPPPPPPQRRCTWRNSSDGPNDHGSLLAAAELVGSEMLEDAIQVKHHWHTEESKPLRDERVSGYWRAWRRSARVSPPSSPSRPSLPLPPQIRL
jgi:hypothetical protein